MKRFGSVILVLLAMAFVPAVSYSSDGDETAKTEWIASDNSLVDIADLTVLEFLGEGLDANRDGAPAPPVLLGEKLVHFIVENKALHNRRLKRSIELTSLIRYLKEGGDSISNSKFLIC